MKPNDLINDLFRTTPVQKRALEKLGLKTVDDLLLHFPTRYHDLTKIKKISSLQSGEHATIYGEITSAKTKKTFRTKIPSAEALVSDGTGSMKVNWFHQPYIAKQFPKGSLVKLEGKVGGKKSALHMANPHIESVSVVPNANDSLFVTSDKQSQYPVYPESSGITSRWFYYSLQKIITGGVLDNISDPIPQEILKKYNLPTLKTALVWIHAPQKKKDSDAARKRFAFQEVFFMQLSRLKQRAEYSKEKSFVIDVGEKTVDEFLSRFPFAPTNAQLKAIADIFSDFKKDAPMMRLLEGDVGSGKTLVAATASYATIMTRPQKQDFGNLQVAYMTPTEILARQHYESFINYFAHLPIQIGLLTGSECRKFPSKITPTGDTHISRTQLLKWVSGGEISILIGTHALIQKSVQFKHLAFVIIDEQHRFGVNQRGGLIKQKRAETVPHLLSMTATPIPRTLALTIFGDLDLTLVDEMPKGRKPIITEIVPPEKRNGVYKKIEEEIEKGRQVYVICPRIDMPAATSAQTGEPDPEKKLALNVKSVKAEAKRLRIEVFPNQSIDILHSKMKPKEKESVMDKFSKGDLDILTATSVVEVGVNVPNATVIIIEGAERFGLAQLHQLRGRVLRSTHQAYCYLFADTKNKTALKRLSALGQAKNGFELSELDLELRGAGQLIGGKQWGISDIGMEAIRNIKMVEAARDEAKYLLEKNPSLRGQAILCEKVALYDTKHLE